ncbi:DUF7619 domain-containing protein [Phaeodactylibacter xiamenensis]|uniref:DUF7619 domain-containing protein n=1 Tax=Phaeodactylibacter xiamenensis TaxID=1524460 RepID=UPI003CCBE7F9
MKTWIYTLLTGIILGITYPVLLGQGWEKEHGNLPLNAIGLSNGKVAFWQYDSLFITSGGGQIQARTSMRSEGAVPNDQGNMDEAAVELTDGTITQLRAISSVITAEEGEAALPKIFLRNINQDGTLNWVKFHTMPEYAPDVSYEFGEIHLDDEGNYYVPAIFRLSSDTRRPLLIKLDDSGELLWVKSYHQEVGSPIPGPASLFGKRGFYQMEDGNLGYVLQISASARLLRLDTAGNILDIVTLDFAEYGPLLVHSTVVGSDIIALRREQLLEPLPNGNWRKHTLSRYDPSGALIWERPLSPEFELTGGSLLTLQNGQVLVLSHHIDGGIHLSWIDPESGENVKTQHFESLIRRFARTVSEMPGGGLILAGDLDLPGGTNIDRGYLLRLDQRGRIFESQIQGTVFEDLDQDCGPLVEVPLQNWIVGFEGGSNRYALTDSLGQFVRRLNAGTYNPVVYPMGPYWSVCPPSPGLGVNAEDTLEVQFPVQARVECPDMHVDISAPFLRRCFESRYTVRYCNRGTLPAQQAYIEVELDDQLAYLGASKPGMPLEDQVYRFDIGRVDVGECGRFTIDVEVNCDETVLGQSHCTTARVFPDSICLPSEGWSGASMEATGACLGDSVQFTLTNVGTAPSTPNLEYLVIEDQVILLQGNYDELEPGEATLITLAANGGTYRIEAEQEPNHPGNDHPTATVEFCGPFPDPESLGFATQYWENDGDASVSIDCQQNIGAYDPNDKRGIPTGYGQEHFIEQGQELEYHIRFQNTGTDTAFTVVIADRISEALDLTSIRPGASSHPYTFSIEKDRHVEFRFENILLPDSTTNLAESVGFVKFKISQKPGLPLGTEIRNQAAIYFDFNEAILTNTTLHTLGRDFITLAEPPTPTDPGEADLTVGPNPSSGPLVFRWSETVTGYLRIFDALGRQCFSSEIAGETFELSGEKFSDGLYIYEYAPEQGAAITGKFLIQR